MVATQLLQGPRCYIATWTHSVWAEQQLCDELSAKMQIALSSSTTFAEKAVRGFQAESRVAIRGEGPDIRWILKI